MKIPNIDPLPTDIEALLQAERRRPGPSAEAGRRVLEHAAAATTGGTPPAATAAGLGSGGTAAGLGGLAKLLSGAFVLATGLGVYSWVRHSEQRAKPSQATVSIDQPGNTATEPVQPAGDSTQAPVRAPTPPTAEPPARNRAPKSRMPTSQSAPDVLPEAQSQMPADVRAIPGESIESTLGAEQALLTEARAALAWAQPDAALEATEEHARRFPQGMLVEERESLAVRALVLGKRNKEAYQRGERFRQRFPASIYQQAVDQTLSSIP